MKVIGFLVMILASTVVYATPGDVECKGDVGNGDNVTLVLAYDHHGQNDPTFIEVQHDGKQVFYSEDVTSKVINVGTDEYPFANMAWIANDEESDVVVRVPEQDQDPNLIVILTLNTDSGPFAVNELEMLCN